MEILQVKENKEAYMDLLLLGDEQENMIYRYLDRGDMYVLMDGVAKAQCVVTEEEDGIIEIKNISVYPKYQHTGCGRALINFIAAKYDGQILQAGTGESPATVPFYEKCGFYFSHRIANYFSDNYEKPIFDGGVKLTDMVYFRRKL